MRAAVQGRIAVRIAGVRRLLFLCSAMVFVDTIFFAALTPLLPFFREEYGLTKASVGVISGAYGAGVLAGSVPGAWLAARAGVKTAAVSGLALVAAMSLLFGIAPNEWVLLAARFLGGFGSALSWVAAFTWLSARAPEERRGEMLGYMISAAVFGALLGPALGSLAALVGVPLAFALLAVLACAIGTWAAVEPAPQASSRGPLFRSLGTLARPHLATAMWFILLSPLLFSALAVLAPLELDRLGWGVAAVGAVFLVGAAVETAIHPLVGRWSDRAGPRGPVVFGVLSSATVLLLLTLPENPWLLALLVVAAAFVFNATLVPGTALLSRGTEKAGMEPAIAFGVTNFAWASGYAIGAPLGGFLADLRGDALAYLVFVPVCLLTLLLLRRTG